MEMELKEIIKKIKDEGVGEAEKRAVDITTKAEAEARAIREAAQKEKEQLVEKGKQEAEKLRKNAEEAIKQASRDVLLALRQKIIGLFDSIIKRDVAEKLSPDILKDMIIRLVEGLAKEKKFEVEILLSEKDKKQLENMLLKEFKKETGKSVTLKVSPNVEHGFLIGEKDGSSYYDFTDEAITEAFKTYLNPKITQILSPGEQQ